MRNPVAAARNEARLCATWAWYWAKVWAGMAAVFALPPAGIGLAWVGWNASTWPAPGQTAFLLASAAGWLWWGVWVRSWFLYPDQQPSQTGGR